jgi:hypothetical protein
MRLTMINLSMYLRRTLLACTVLCAAVLLHAQHTGLQFFSPDSKEHLNTFETSKVDDTPFDGLRVHVGGDFALQFQGLSQTNSGDTLLDLAKNFNLPTANLNLDVQLVDGMRMHLRTYLSSRHHPEAYVKGGYLQIDKLDFIKPGFLSGFMEIATIKVGMDEINYGDAHFRRSDNARTITNPFVGKYIMDAFTTEPFLELTLQKQGFLGVVGFTNGRLNQSPVKGDDGIVLYGKLGYDKQVSDDLRLRFTGSLYSSSNDGSRDYLYGGDRAGARYYLLFDTPTSSAGDFSVRYNPRFAYQTAFQINPFVKYKGLEFFGIFEMVSDGSDAGGSFTQFGAELLYRFGGQDQLYVGGRYNGISGELTDSGATREISRVNVGGGWFLTNNVLAKLEYVSETLDGDGWNGSRYEGAEFSGIVFEATISF